MPATTACAGIRYPLASDAPNFAQDMKNLADDVDAAVCGSKGLFVGMIVPWYQPPGGGQALPAGMLYCDGASFNPATYPDLAAHLGSSNTPNLEGRFLRGRGGDSGTGIFTGYGQTGGYPDPTLVQHSHLMKNHTHPIGHTHGSVMTLNEDPAHVHAPLDTTNVTETWVARLSAAPTPATGTFSLQEGSGMRVHYTSATTAGSAHQHLVNIPALSASAQSSAPNDNTSNTAGTASVANRNLPPFTNVTYLIVAAAN